MVKMGSWSKKEDDKLIAYIHAHGEGRWKSLPKAAGLRRRVKSCRRRWVNYLKPDLRKGNFYEEEDELIIEPCLHIEPCLPTKGQRIKFLFTDLIDL
ncbi:hypothetical protein SUGI_0540110 [Cryptomeria japonica]|nr:hypothetical protein SUGI_0540110 [Cryptomeria japonica]